MRTTKPDDATTVYRRTARRLRARYAGDVGALHRSLRSLADQQDAKAPVDRSPSRTRVIAMRHSPAQDIARAWSPESRTAQLDEFVRTVESSISGPVVTYSERARLLQKAHKLGVRRFDANLVITAALHRTLVSRRPSSSRAIPRTWIVFALTQSAIVLGAWQIVRHFAM